MRLTIVPKTIIDTTLITSMVEEVVGPLNSVEDVKELAKQFKLPSFNDLYKDIKEIRKISAVKNALDIISFKVFTEKFHSIQNAKNLLMDYKDSITELKRKWDEIQRLVDSVYNIEKNRMLLFESIRSLRNKELQQAVVDTSLNDIVNIKSKITFINSRIDNVMTDIKETFDHLDSTYSLISRQFTVVQLGADLGQVRT